MKTIQVAKVPSEHPLDTVARMVGSRVILADSLGVSAAAIGNWKQRGVPIEKCPEIERFGKPIVTRRDLRPNDWQKIWPELVTAQESTEKTGDTMREGTVRRQDTRRADDITVGHDRRGNDVFAQPMSQVPAQEV